MFSALHIFSLCSCFFHSLIRNWPIVFQAYVNCFIPPLRSGFSLLICELHDYPQLEIHFCNHIAISCIFRNGFFQPLLYLVPVVLVLNRNLYLSTKYWVLESLKGHKNHSPSHRHDSSAEIVMARETCSLAVLFHEWASQAPLFSWDASSTCNLQPVLRCSSQLLSKVHCEEVACQKYLHCIECCTR